MLLIAGPSNMLVYLRDGSSQEMYVLSHCDRSCRSNFLSHSDGVVDEGSLRCVSNTRKFKLKADLSNIYLSKLRMVTREHLDSWNTLVKQKPYRILNAE